MESKQIQSRTFDRMFTTVENPRTGDDQFEYMELKDQSAIDKADTENRLWTVLDCNGKLYISAGRHFVNRMHYVITEEPYDQLYTARW
jgi:hypothetical protein